MNRPFRRIVNLSVKVPVFSGFGISSRLCCRFVIGVIFALCVTMALRGALADDVDQAKWLQLSGDATRNAWQRDNKDWIVAGDAALDPTNPRKLVAKPGKGVLISTLAGLAKLRNLTSKQRFADLEVHVEFLLPRRGNAGVKLQGLYEIQISDSHKKESPTASDCGGVYPRAELKPRYHTIDKGTPPRCNAAKPPGAWQTLDILFQAPRFDAKGKKTANARFIKVVLNGKEIHKDVELKWPTGHAWHNEKEVARGPLFLQGDHGPIAYRNVRVREIGAAVQPRVRSKARPNIVLIMCDDMGWSDVGCYGSEINTPNIDRLAAEGLQFTQFYNNAVCWTTRASVITGCFPRYPRPHLRENMATIAELLRSAGYQTALSGKWHLGRTETTHPLRRGFDRYYGLLDGCCNYFDPFFRDPKYKWAITGDGHRYFADNHDRITEFPDGFYTTDAFSDRAVRMIHDMVKRPSSSSPSASSPRPFFLHVCYTAPHYPIQAKPADIAKYRGKYAAGWQKMQAVRFQRQKALGLVDPAWELPALDPEAKAWDADTYPHAWQQQRMEAYAAMIDCVDQGIGRILKALEETGVEKNTLVMFLSDNGPDRSEFSDAGPNQVPGAKEYYTTVGPGWAFAQNTPFRRYKTWMHEGGIATPMIARWPGHVRPNTKTSEVAHIIDFLPTCLELAGMQPPDSFDGRKLVPVDGHSFVSLLNGQPHQIHDWLFWELRNARAVRNGKWKLVTEPSRDQWELYDLELDRTETNNLADRYSDRVKRMARAWWQWAEKTGVSAHSRKPKKKVAPPTHSPKKRG